MFFRAILKVRTIDWRLELVMASGEVFHLFFVLKYHSLASLSSSLSNGEVLHLCFFKYHICIFVIFIILGNFDVTLKS